MRPYSLPLEGGGPRNGGRSSEQTDRYMVLLVSDSLSHLRCQLPREGAYWYGKKRKLHILPFLETKNVSKILSWNL